MVETKVARPGEAASSGENKRKGNACKKKGDGATGIAAAVAARSEKKKKQKRKTKKKRKKKRKKKSQRKRHKQPRSNRRWCSRFRTSTRCWKSSGSKHCR